jgi:perosamine synthetase
MTDAVAEFEREFADYVGAEYAIALCNGTATLHTAVSVLIVATDDSRVTLPPLTMASTAIGAIHAGARLRFVDVNRDAWIADGLTISVSLYGLHASLCLIDDAAQTLRPHNERALFTSYSFQASKILALGEGGMLTTNDKELATAARRFSSLGYQMDARQPRIDKDSIKDANAIRHHVLGWNYRMAPAVAERGIQWFVRAYGNTWADGSIR